VQVSPDTKALVLREVVAKCWKVKYKDIGKSIEDIRHIQLEGVCKYGTKWGWEGLVG
jgi:hypothetical protein